jgi:hypothetical protein
MSAQITIEEVRSADLLTVLEPAIHVTVETEADVKIDIAAEVGPPGPQGPQGPQGPAGIGSKTTYVHDQMVPDAVWTIQHDQNCFPTVTVVDSAGSAVEGAVTYDSPDQITILFSGGFSGKAYLN